MDNLNNQSPNNFGFTKFAAVMSANSQTETHIKVDRYLLSKTWYSLLQKLSGRNPTLLDKALIDMAYKKIIEAMKQKTDEELLMDMQDIIDSVDYARLSFIGIPDRGYFSVKKK